MITTERSPNQRPQSFLRKQRTQSQSTFTPATAFGEWLRAERLSRGLTYESLADRFSSAATVVFNLEKGMRNPSRKMVGRICVALIGEDADERVAKILLSAGLKSAGFAPEEEPGVSIATPMSDLVRQVMQNQARNSPDIDLTPEQADKLISEIEQYAQFQFSRILREIDSKKN